MDQDTAPIPEGTIEPSDSTRKDTRERTRRAPAQPAAHGHPSAAARLDDPAHRFAVRQSGLLALTEGNPFERLLRVAAHALQAPAAALIVVDGEGGRLVSAFGLSAPPRETRQPIPLAGAPWEEIVATGSPRLLSLSGDHAWPLPDLTECRSVASLAGAPVRDGEGHTVAALCALDCRTRQWTAGERDLLEDVAMAMRDQLAQRRAMGEAEGQAQERLAVQYAVSRILVSATDLESAAPRILHAVCEGLRWQLGALWLVDEAANQLRCHWSWTAPGTHFFDFQRATHETAFVSGEGLPGQVYAGRKPLWVSDLPPQSNCPRIPIAAREGLRSAFAFPLRGGGKVLGVGEFFSTQTRPVDEDLVQAISTVGNQIGQFLVRQRAEAAMRASEARRGVVLDVALDAIVSMDADGAILEFNPMAEKLFGYRREEVIGGGVADLLIPPSLRERHREGLRRYLRTGQGRIIGQRIELAAMRRDGSEFPVELAVARLPGAGAPSFVGFIRDITARRKAQEEHAWLLVEAQRARDTAETAIQRLFAVQSVTDSALMHLALDQLLAELLQRIRSVLRVDNATILLLDEDGEYLTIRGVSGLEEDIERGTRVPFGEGFAGRIAEYRVPLIVDDTREFELYSDILHERLRSLAGVPLLANDRVVGVLHVGATVPRHFSAEDGELLQLVADRIALAIDHARLFLRTQRAFHQVEDIAQQLADQVSQVDAMIEAIPHGVYVCDAQGLQMRVNAHGAALLGLPLDLALQPVEAFGVTNMPRTLDGERVERDDFPLARGLRGEIHTDLRLICRRFDTGTDLYVLASCAPLRNSAGAITGAVSVFTDITHMYRLERQKDDFLSIASHELKTPLTSLKILAQLTRRRLERAGLTESEHTIRMERAISRIERLVNDLLDASRIDSGKLALHRAKADLVAICRAAAEEEMAATERAITLELPDAPVQVEVDVDRLAEVFTNLLSNALKYSPHECMVTLTLRVDGDAAVVTVRDEGAGIPPESLPYLFERFYRVPGVQVQSGSGVGLGLGLFITKEIVERHGGTISVESAVGEGAAFIVRLPLATSSQG